MGHSEYYVQLEALLTDSPITRDSVTTDVRDLMTAGEFALAFDTMCSWIYDDSLPVEREYHARLVAAAETLGSRELVTRIGELVRESG